MAERVRSATENRGSLDPSTKSEHPDKRLQIYVYKKSDETVDHLLADCPVSASKEYKAPHDLQGQYIHWNVCKH